MYTGSSYVSLRRKGYMDLLLCQVCGLEVRNARLFFRQFSLQIPRSATTPRPKSGLLSRSQHGWLLWQVPSSKLFLSSQLPPIIPLSAENSSD